MKTTLKGTGMTDNFLLQFKDFEAFYKWGSELYEGTKKEFEEVYYSFHPKPKIKGVE